MSDQRTPEEILEDARKLIGLETEPIAALYPVEYEPIRRYCHAAWDDNPLFLDPEYARSTRYCGVICPPLATRAVIVLPGGPLDSPFPPPKQAIPTLPRLPSPGKTNVNLGVEWDSFRPVRVGDHLSESSRYADIYMKGIRIDPKAFFFVVERIYRNQYHQVVASSRMTGIMHRSPEEVRTAGETVREEQAGPERKGETRRSVNAASTTRESGARPLTLERGVQCYWEDVQEGDELPSISYPLTITQMVLFVSATQAWSPIHHDREETQRRGWADIFPGGMSIQACFSRLLMDFLGEHGWIKRFQVQFRRMNHPGTTMIVRGKVLRKYVQDGEHLLDLDLWAETPRDGVTAPAGATVTLPSRG